MEIKVYGTEICPKCTILKKKLKEKNIEFEECMDINEMRTLGINAVPVMSVGGNLMNFLEATRWVNEKKSSD